MDAGKLWLQVSSLARGARAISREHDDERSIAIGNLLDMIEACAEQGIEIQGDN